MPKISLFSPLEGDYASRSAELARQQKLADMLMQMSQQEIPVSTAGGITAPVSPYGALAKALTSFGGSYLAGKSEEDEKSLKEDARKEAIKALGNLREIPGTTATLPGQEFTLKGIQPNYTPNMNSEFPEPEVKPLINALKMGGINYNLPATPRSYEEQSQMLDEMALSENPYIAQMAAAQRPRIEAERDRMAPKIMAVGEYGNMDTNPNSPTYGEYIAKPQIAAAKGNTLDQYIAARDSLPANDSKRQIYQAAIDKLTTRDPGANVTVKLPPGVNKADETIGEMYAKYITGDSASVRKNMNQLGIAINTINAKPELFGNMSGILPIEIRRAFPGLKEGANVQQMMEDVVQTNLRQVLGPQFTAKEGEGLMRRVFDPAQPAAVNADRATRLLRSIQEAAQAKQDVMNYFGKNSTISGYQPKIAMVGSVDEILQNAGLDVGYPQPSGSKQDPFGLRNPGRN